MYALIYDEYRKNIQEKQILSLHASRKEAEKVLSKRQKDIGKRVWECNTRIIWTDKAFQPGDVISQNDFVVWRKGEQIPEGELNSDSD